MNRRWFGSAMGDRDAGIVRFGDLLLTPAQMAHVVDHNPDDFAPFEREEVRRAIAWVQEVL